MAEGVIRGTVEGSLRVFRGVRYAAPPFGDLRFRPPDPPAAFSGVRDAIEFGDICAQPAAGGTTTGSEDCLFLNIWSHDDDIVRPVIVFNHGGSANGVGGSNSTLGGTTLATDGDVIVVTLNRRLGALGYLAIDELIQESPRTTAGNYAVLDVIAALEWLNENIASFNGDPARIMLAGQSAGGAVSCGVLSSPDASGLFNSAALHSGGCRSRQVLNDQVGIPTDGAWAMDEHARLVTQLGCDTGGDVLGCLRDLPAEDVILAAAQVDADFSTVIDGNVIAGTIQEALSLEVAGSLPVIIGSTADEMVNILGPNPVADDAEYRQVLEFIFEQPLSDDLYALYPTASFDSASDAFLTLFGDLLFNCVAEDMADSAEGGAPAYLFHFARGFDNGPSAGTGAFHTIDVAHLFGSFDNWGYTPDAEATAISEAMRTAWVGLVSDPSVAPSYLAAPATAWPAYFSMNQQIVEYGEAIDIATEHRGGRCPSLSALL